MIDNNMQYNGQKRRKQKRRSYQFFIPALFVVMMIAEIFYLLFSEGNSRESIIVNPTDSQPGLVVSGDIPEESTGSNTPQPSNADNDWNLTLVNKWNPFPENYALTLEKRWMSEFTNRLWICWKQPKKATGISFLR